MLYMDRQKCVITRLQSHEVISLPPLLRHAYKLILYANTCGHFSSNTYWSNPIGLGLNEKDWTKSFGTKPVGRKGVGRKVGPPCKLGGDARWS